MQFPVERISSERPPLFQLPKEIARFRFDHNRQLHFDHCTPPYYFPLNLSNQQECNLSFGFPEKYIERDESIPEHLDALLYTLLHTQTSAFVKEINFITWRGILTRFLCAPYANDEWEFRACKIGNTIYIEEPCKTPAKEEEYANQKRMCYWGYRFEVVSTIPCRPSDLVDGRTDPRVQNRIHGSVNTNVQYCTVVKTKLGENSIIVGAEVDCLGEDDAYVELKTSKAHESHRDKMKFEKFKLIKFYFQSFIVGIPKIYVGFRDSQGQVKSVEKLETLKIPRIVRPNAYWDPNVCLSFANGLLNYLKTCIIDEKCVYRVRFKRPFNAVEVELCLDEKVDFIPSKYEEYLK